MTEPLTFSRCVLACWQHPEFMHQYRRLTRAKLGLVPKVHPIEAMIDQATGAPVLDPKEARAFFDFVRDCIWIPVNAAIAKENAKR